MPKICPFLSSRNYHRRVDVLADQNSEGWPPGQPQKITSQFIPLLPTKYKELARKPGKRQDVVSPE